jgi:hypothetical protein
MIPNSHLWVFFLFLALSPVPAAAAPTPEEPEKGAVVEEVTKGWAADRAHAGRWSEAEAVREEATRRLQRSQPAAAAHLLRDSRC